MLILSTLFLIPLIGHGWTLSSDVLISVADSNIIHNIVKQHIFALMADLETRIRSLEDGKAEDNRVMKELTAENEILKTKVDELSSSLQIITTNQNVISDPSLIDSHKTKMLPMEDQNNVSTRDTIMEPVIKKDSNRVVQRPERTTHHDAFFAILDEHDIVATPGQKVSFNDVKTNIGGAYDNNTGIFTCQQTGVYVFSWSVASSRHSSFETYLVKQNGERYGSYVSGTLSTLGGINAIVELNIGDTMWISVGSFSGIKSHGYNQFSMFSGFRLY